MPSISDSRLATVEAPPSSDRPVRLAIFTTHPIQYQAPLFRALAAREELAPVVFFGSRHGLDVSFDPGFGTAFRWDVPLLSGYEHVFLPHAPHPPRVGTFFGLRVRGLRRRWTRYEFDAAIVLGWYGVGNLQAIGAALGAGIPLLLRGESNLLRPSGRGARAWLRDRLWIPTRRRLYAALFRRVDAFLTIGSRNAEYYRAFGVPEHKLHWAPYGVDNAHFALPDEQRERVRASRRRALALEPQTVLFTAPAKLLPMKRPLDLLAAFAALRARGADAHLLYLGDGPERGALEAAIDAAGLRQHVTISGFVNQSAMPEWYAASDCVVLPSDALETWGLAVNEGMAAGLPVVVSDAAGCAPDLVQAGANGFTFPLGDTDALADRLARIVDAGPAGRRAMGTRSRAIVADFTVERVADAVVAALQGLGVSPGAAAK